MAYISDEAESETGRCEWDFKVSGVICSSRGGSDAIGVVEFDESNSLVATGGIARKIRIYKGRSEAWECEYYMYTPAKLSSLKWKPGWGSRVIGSGDYDGVVMEYDLERRVGVFERDEHGGRRVWSIDYSPADPTLGASASDDGTMQMWDTRCHASASASASAIRPDRAACSPVCCVEFNPLAPAPTVALACADRRIYAYDARMTAQPVFVLEGHHKAVSYARFLDSRTLVSSSVDGSLIMWDAQDQDRRLLRRYSGHLNTRRFVGLSLWRGGGLFSCGSENNRVFVYDKRWGDPIWVHPPTPQPQPQPQGFVSSVCWHHHTEDSHPDRCTLVAAASDGVLQVFQAQRNNQYPIINS